MAGGFSDPATCEIQAVTIGGTGESPDGWSYTWDSLDRSTPNFLTYHFTFTAAIDLENLSLGFVPILASDEIPLTSGSPDCSTFAFDGITGSIDTFSGPTLVLDTGSPYPVWGYTGTTPTGSTYEFTITFSTSSEDNCPVAYLQFFTDPNNGGGNIVGFTLIDCGSSTEAVWEFAEADWTACVSNEAVWEFSEAEWSTCQDVAEITPVVAYPSPPDIADSTVPAQPRLGIGYYQVGIFSRGGEHLMTMLPRVTGIEYGRVLDDTSSSTVTCVSEEWADLIHPWQHEVHIFRNRNLAWSGPVRDKDYDPETGEIKIEGRDLFAWMDFRSVHEEIDLTEVDVADVFAALVAGALKPDPSPNITVDKQTAGSTIDFYYDPETPKIVAVDLRSLAEGGVDFTVVNRKLYIRGEYLDKAPIATLLRSHLAKVPIVKESGEMATQLYLTGSGGEVHSHPDKPLSADQWALHPYGLLEQIYDAEKFFDSDDVSAIERAGKSRYELMKEPRLFLNDMQLDKSAPVEMEDLIPGRRMEVRMDVGSVPLITTYRLQSLKVTVDATSETVALEVTSLGDYDKDTPL